MRTFKGKVFEELLWQDGARAIDACSYFYAKDIQEIEELTLQVTIAEAKAQASLIEDEVSGPLAFLKIGGNPIEVDETCRTFQLRFDSRHMISYTVTNETYGKYPQPPETFEGNLFRVFSRSHLLEYTARTSYASDEHPGPGPLMHFEIVCLNHVIDVICTGSPRIWVR